MDRGKRGAGKALTNPLSAEYDLLHHRNLATIGGVLEY
jgi:hypothetical protein